MSDIRTVTLTTPIPYGDGKTLDTLRFRRPKAGDLRGIKLARLEEAEADTVLTLAQRTSMDAVSAAQLAELSVHDVLTLTAELLAFFAPPGAMLPASPTTPAPPGAS